MQLEIRADPAEVGRARRWARARLAGSAIAADGPLAETLVLIVSELVTNAVVQLGCPAVLRLCLPQTPAPEKATVRLEVADGSTRAPVPRWAECEETGGRGLALVDGLADRWGWSPEGAWSASGANSTAWATYRTERPRSVRTAAPWRTKGWPKPCDVARGTGHGLPADRAHEVGGAPDVLPCAPHHTESK
ncbi:hypothetical protein SGLAM104S_07738 [Streptomyces glaucescens]